MNPKKHTHFRPEPPKSEGTRDRRVGCSLALPASGGILYDTLIILAIWVFTIVALVTLIGDAVLGAWVQTLLFIEMYAFLAFFWCQRGQTIGMLAWHLRIRSDGRFTPTQALGRFIGGLASFATLGLGFIWMWFDRDRMTWSDRLSGSIVVRVRD